MKSKRIIILTILYLALISIIVDATIYDNSYSNSYNVSLINYSAPQIYSLNISNNTHFFGNTTHLNVVCSQQNCSELRVTQSDTILIPFWFEINTSDAGVYGLLHFNITSNSSNYKIQTNSTSIKDDYSNGYTTFPIFDSFNGTTINDSIWTSTTGVTVSNDNVTVTADGTIKYIWAKKKVPIDSHVRFKATLMYVNDGYIGFTDDPSNNINNIRYYVGNIANGATYLFSSKASSASSVTTQGISTQPRIYDIFWRTSGISWEVNGLGGTNSPKLITIPLVPLSPVIAVFDDSKYFRAEYVYANPIPANPMGIWQQSEPTVDILSWGNNVTNNNTLHVFLDINHGILFNVTATNTTLYEWYKDDILVGSNYNNFSTNWSGGATQTIKVCVNSCQKNVTWNISLNDTEPPETIYNLSSYINLTGVPIVSWSISNSSDYSGINLYINSNYNSTIIGQSNFSMGYLPIGTYLIGTQTIDQAGNINLTWKNISVNIIDLPVTNCGNVGSGKYLLYNSLYTDDTCITVLGNDTYIELRNYTIHYGNNSDGYGIKINPNLKNITLKNISLFQTSSALNTHGLYISSDSNITISNYRAIISDGYGINAVSSNNITVSGLYSYIPNSKMVSFSYVTDSNISDSKVTNSETMLYSEFSSNISFINNSINVSITTDYTLPIISINQGNTHNIAYNNIDAYPSISSIGIYIYSSGYNNIYKNYIDTIDDGVLMEGGSPYNNITYNNITTWGNASALGGSGQKAIPIKIRVGGEYTRTTNNNITTMDGGRGIYFQSASFGNISYNHIVTHQTENPHGIVVGGSVTSHTEAHGNIINTPGSTGIGMYYSNADYINSSDNVIEQGLYGIGFSIQTTMGNSLFENESFYNISSKTVIHPSETHNLLNITFKNIYTDNISVYAYINDEFTFINTNNRIFNETSPNSAHGYPNGTYLLHVLSNGYNYEINQTHIYAGFVDDVNIVENSVLLGELKNISTTGNISWLKFKHFSPNKGYYLKYSVNGTVVSSSSSDANGNVNFSNLYLGGGNYFVEQYNYDSVSWDNAIWDLQNGAYISIPYIFNATNITLTPGQLQFWLNNSKIQWRTNTNKTLTNINYNDVSDVYLFNASGTNGYLSFSSIMKNINTSYSLYIDNILIATNITDITGSLTFNYTGVWSNHIFLVNLTSSLSYTNTTPLLSGIINNVCLLNSCGINFDVNQSNAITQIKYGTDISLSSNTVNQTTGTSRTVNITGLTNNVTYYYSVWAWNSSNMLFYSNSTIKNFMTSQLYLRLSGTVTPVGSTISATGQSNLMGGAYDFGQVFETGKSYWVNISKFGYTSNNTLIQFAVSNITWDITLQSIPPITTTNFSWWNSITQDDKIIVHVSNGAQFRLLFSGITSTEWTQDGLTLSETSPNLTTSFITNGHHNITGQGATLTGLTPLITWSILKTRAMTDANDVLEPLDTSGFDLLKHSMSSDTTGVQEFFAALMSPYTNPMGTLFFIFLYVMPLVIIWVRQEKALIPVGLMLIFGGILSGSLPVSWILPARIILAVTMLGILYSIYKERG